MNKEEKLWTIDETAEFLSLKPDTVRGMARNKRIPAIKVGRVWRFEPRDIADWLRSQKNETNKDTHSCKK